MKPGIGASGIFANGATARKVATDSTRNATAIRRSLGPAVTVERHAGRLRSSAPSAEVASFEAPSGDVMAFPDFGTQVAAPIGPPNGGGEASADYDYGD